MLVGPGSAPSPLTIRLFGPFEVRVDGQPLPRLRFRKSESVLALLALRHGGEVDRAWLAGLLWPESRDSQALRNCLTDLRRALGPASGRLTSPTPHTLRLDLTDADVDVVAFDTAIERGDPASLEEAVALYRGPLLEGCVEEWAFQERQGREQVYLAARERLAALALEQGEVADAERHLRLAVAVDLLRESTQRGLMQVLAASGNFAGALLCYRELRLRLHRELNVEPDAETQTLFQQLRSEARRLAAKSSGAPMLRSETAYLLAAGARVAERNRAPVGVIADSPPLDTSVAVRHNLPIALNRFIGREAEKDEVRRLLSATRLLTVTGAGGCGKTRLALQVAAVLLDDYPDGVWLVELASLADPKLVPQAVASTLAVPEEPGRSLTETLADAVRTRSLVLVLDNCEHLIDACAALAEALLRACPRLRLLATSREGLNIPGETVYLLPSLRVPAEERLPLEALAQIEAVQLFLDRARAVTPAFALTETNAAAVTRVCRRLDGIPLAIELAAARTKALSMEQLDQRLDDMFRLLIGGARTALPRHRTLRAMMDWSYNFVSEPERALLRRLSVFAGGWTLEAAEAVCSGEPIESCHVLDLLAQLVEKSLVLYEPAGDEARYRLLETVRQYARDRLLEAESAVGVRNGHRDWFMALAEQAEPNLRSGAQQVAWLDRLEREHDNLRAALAWSEAQGQTDASLRLGGALWRFWSVRGYLAEGCERLRSVLSRPEAVRPTVERARALDGAGLLAMNCGDFTTASAYFEEALSIGQALDDQRVIATARNSLGDARRFQGDAGAAHGLYEEALRLGRELNDRWNIAYSLTALGILASQQGDSSAARPLFEEGLTIKRALGDKRSIAYSLIYLANMTMEKGDASAARSLYEEGLTIYQGLSDRRGIAFALSGLGMVAHKQGKFGVARALLGESLAIFREVGDKKGIVEELHWLAMVAVVQAQSECAARLFGAAEGLSELIDAALPPVARAERDQAVAAVRTALGEEAFAAAWAQGRAMSLEEAMSCAMGSAFGDQASATGRRVVASAAQPDLAARDLPAGFSAPRSLEPLPNNLSLQLTSFIGRVEQIAAVQQRILPRKEGKETRRLVTLTGAGGCGKTRLALQVAVGLLDEYPDGVWLVELAPLADPSLVPQAAAAELGVPEQPGRPMVETLVEALKPKRFLLVLDNCEHLVAACARLAETLLQSCPGLRLLATSRESLGVPGELTYRVPSLSLPDPRELPSLEELSKFEAIRLFADRAESALPTFAVTRENAAAVAQVCHWLDGIPLAIELAAARVKALPVEKLAERLDDVFRLLTGGCRTALPRHQTLRALIDWSYDLLSEPERALLRRLSVFSGGWTLEAAEGICAGGDIEEWEVLDLLTALVEKSLVQYEEEGQAARYRLLETVRQYGRDRLLESGEADATRDRHLAFFLALAEAAELKLRTAAKKEWLERLEAEHDNFRAALAWCQSTAGDGEIGLRLAAALWWFWFLHDHWSEGRGWLERALARSDARQRTAARAKALEGAGFLTGDCRLGEESVALFRELGDPLGLAGTLRTLGMNVLDEGDLASARSLYEESLAICQQHGDRWGLIPSLYGLADLAFRQSEHATAQSLWEQSTQICREAGDQWMLSWSLEGLGLVAGRRGDWGAARAYHKESLLVFQALGNQWGIVLGLADLAGMAGGQDQPERAARLFGAAEGQLEAAGMGAALVPRGRADWDRRIAAVRTALSEQAFAAAWAAGHAMTLEQAIAYGLEETGPA